MNPFDKYFGNEDRLQIQIVKYIQVQYPKIWWNHTTNEGRRTPFERYKAQALGIRAGCPDLMIFEPKRLHINGTDSLAFVGLAIELKWGKNKTTPAQDEWLQRLKDRFWATAVCYTFEETKKIIDDYFAYTK